MSVPHSEYILRTAHAPRLKSIEKPFLSKAKIAVDML